MARGGSVVAPGGGVPVDGENRRLMRESGVVVLREAQAETIRARQTEADGGGEESARPWASPLRKSPPGLAAVAA